MADTTLPNYVKRNIIAMAPYELHKKLVNNYFTIYRGSKADFKRDTSSDKRDSDIIRENHKFLWADDETPETWEAQLAKKYYDKLFKEYCICDLSRYKENKVALRWQIEAELISGKGQFICGSKHCSAGEGLRTWEVNFSYVEHGEKKSALVKLRLCPDCSYKLNYKHRRKEVTKSKRPSTEQNSREDNIKTKKLKVSNNEDEPSEEPCASQQDKVDQDSSNVWKSTNILPEEEKSRDEDFNEYLENLFM